MLIKVSTGSDEVSKDMKELVYEVASMSDKIKLEEAVLDRTPSFSISRMTEDIGITFAGIP